MVNKSSTLLVAVVLISATSTLAAPESLLSSGASLQGREFDEEFDTREPQWAALGEMAVKVGGKVLPKIFSKFGKKAAGRVASHALDAIPQGHNKNQRRGLVPFDDEESIFVREPEFDMEILGRDYSDLEARSKKSHRRRRNRKKHHKKPKTDPTGTDPTQSDTPPTTPADAAPPGMGGDTTQTGAGDTTQMGARSLDSFITGDLFVREPEFDMEILGRDYSDLEARSKKSHRRRRNRKKHHKKPKTDPTGTDPTQSDTPPTTPTDATPPGMGGGDTTQMGAGDPTQMGARSLDSIITGDLFVREPEFDMEILGRDYSDLEARSKKSHRRRRNRKKHHKKPKTDPTGTDPTQSDTPPTTPTDATPPGMGGGDPSQTGAGDTTQMGARSFDGMDYFEGLVGRDFEVNELD